MTVLIPEAPTGDDAVARKAPGHSTLRGLTRGQGLAGLVLVGVVAAVGLLAPLLTPYGPFDQIQGANLVGPGSAHWFGTDEVNRDVFTRTAHGIRTNLLIVFAAVAVGAALGTALGLVSSTNQFADVVTQRVFDVVLAFPALILGIALAAVVGPGAVTVGIVIVVVEVPIFGRLVRSSVLKVRELQFVESAEVIGAGHWWILRSHILPNSLEPLGVQVALSLSVAVFVEAGMSFIGVGVRAPEPSLGSLISNSVANLDANPMYAIGPLAVVTALVLGFLLVAQGLAQAHRAR
ncbi:ABC transporter permease [Rhodococcus triatomae]|uniref:Peptide/nickel transport system permease protein n=1 Tax=Rhodococcus triatomae TaxID=300028 RepID=A0A1G8DEJ1_9NOCA|nr:ABC transporter permease [Rhodococcus triatomae]QNG18444.1 ABC transporter permease [Rhodococcus triatomae]QNG21886.1 ABC transporter permease [Rhodococcus triatomae]SDH56128.1 peptide/nickel transport system permease protein [Rhodococcus triatomae]